MTSFLQRLLNHVLNGDYWPFSSKRTRSYREDHENLDDWPSPPKRHKRFASPIVPKRALQELNQPTVTTVKNHSSFVAGQKPGFSFSPPGPLAPGPQRFKWTEPTVVVDNEDENVLGSHVSPRLEMRSRKKSSLQPLASIDLTNDETQKKSSAENVPCIDLTNDETCENVPNGRLPYKGDSFTRHGSRRKGGGRTTSFSRTRHLSGSDLSMSSSSLRRYSSQQFGAAGRSGAVSRASSFRQSIDIQERMNFGRLLGSIVQTSSPNPAASPPRPTPVIDLSNDDDDEPGASSSSFIIPSSTNINKSQERSRRGSGAGVPGATSAWPSEPSSASSATLRGVQKEARRTNSFEEKIKGKPCNQSNVVDEILQKYRESRETFFETTNKFEREVKLWDEANRKRIEAVLEEKLMRQLKITESLLPELPAEPYPPIVRPLPELSPEMLDKVKNALTRGSLDQQLIDKHGYQIRKRDIATLNNQNWLNDEVINFYLVLIMKRSEELDNYPKVYTFSTFFYGALQSRGHNGVKRWTKKVNLFEKDIIIIPIHLQVHWCLLTIDLKKKEINYFDSMGNDNNKCLTVVSEYLKTEHKVKQESDLDISGFKLENVKEIPQQMNGSDCGVFACTYAEYSSRRAPFDFSQTNMPYFRRKMIYEIITGDLL